MALQMLDSFTVSCATERFQMVQLYRLAYSSLLRPIIQPKGKRMECFKQRCEESLRSQSLLVTVFQSQNGKATEASSSVALPRTRAGGRRWIRAQRLIKPEQLAALNGFQRKSQRKKSHHCHLPTISNSSPKYPTPNMKIVLLVRGQNCTFALLLEEPTGMAGLAVDHQLTVEDDLLLCGFLTANTRGPPP